VRGLRVLLGNRGFQTVWSASVVSGLGDRIAVIALYLLVYNIAGRAIDLGVLAAVQILPAILLGPIAGLVLDRCDRRHVMIASDLGSALVVALLPLARSLEVVYLLAALLAVGRQFTGPARLAVVPDLVPAEDLGRANALTMMTKNVLLLVGPAIGGGIVALWGTGPAFWLDGATFLVSALLLFARPFVSVAGRTGAVGAPDASAAGATGTAGAAAPAAGHDGRGSLWERLGEGLVLLWRRPRLRFAFLFLASTVFVSAMQTPLVVLFIKGILQRGDAELGGVLAMSGLGGLLGAVAGGLLPAGRGPLRTISWVLALDGLLLVLFAVNHLFVLALVLFAAFGALGTVAQISLATFLQSETPQERRGRIFGWLGGVIGPLSLLSVTLGAAAAEAFGVVLVLACSGMFELIVGIVGRLTIPRPALAEAVAEEHHRPQAPAAAEQ
jgi:DHA3 family macrolide efflux protein-like MFS transporter